MSRIVVTTRDGAPLDDLEVDGLENVGRQVATWIKSLPGLPIYIDGRLLDDDLRQKMLLSMAQADAASAATVPLQPSSLPPRAGSITSDEFATYNQLLGQAADDVRRAHFQVVEQAQAFTTWQLRFFASVGEMMIERDKQSSEEAARQRKMTHQSLRDIDLLDRSIKVTEVNEVFQGISAKGASSANARMIAPSRIPMDWMQAIATFVGGFKQSETKPDESK